MGKEWDPDRLQVDTLPPSDPRIQADKIVAGSLNLGVLLTKEQLAYLRRTVMKGSS